MKRAHILLFVKSIALSAVYFFAPSTYTKPWVIWMLAVEAFTYNTSYSKSIGIGLVLSSFGDIFLELDDEKAFDLFVPGLLSFLLAHLMYIKALKESLMKGYAYAVTLLLIYLLTITSMIVPKAEYALRVPIVVYASVICTMVFYAINRAFYRMHSLSSQRFALAGALVFAVSDTILALNKFYTPFENGKLLVMVTYYLGQTLLAASCINDLTIKIA